MVMRILYFLSHFYTSLAPDFEVPYGPAERWGGFGSAIGPAGCAGGAKERYYYPLWPVLEKQV